MSSSGCPVCPGALQIKSADASKEQVGQGPERDDERKSGHSKPNSRTNHDNHRHERGDKHSQKDSDMTG